MILVGVCGGIAAYKSCELVRLLVKDGHDVQVVQTPDSRRFVGPTTFAALSRRPVLTDGGDDVFPHLDASKRRRAPVHRAAVGHHDGADRPRRGGQRPHRHDARVHRPDRRRPGDEPAHVGGRGRRGRTSGCSRPAASSWSARDGRDRRGRAGRGPDGRAGRDRRRRRGRASPPAGRWPACACSSPPAAPASRSTPSATSGTARPGRMGAAVADEAARRGADVTLVLAAATARPVGADARRPRRDGGRARAGHRSPRRPGADVIVMAAAVSDYRPADAADRQAHQVR